RIAIAEKAQMLVAIVAGIDPPHHAEDLRGLAVGIGIPAAAVFYPQRAPPHSSVRPEQAFYLKSNAVSFIATRRVHDRIIAAGEVLGVEMGGKASPGCQRLFGAVEEVRGVCAPEDLVRFDDPMIGRLAGGRDRAAEAIELDRIHETRPRPN